VDKTTPATQITPGAPVPYVITVSNVGMVRTGGDIARSVAAGVAAVLAGVGRSWFAGRRRRRFRTTRP
jgi:hypothetical protein